MRCRTRSLLVVLLCLAVLPVQVWALDPTLIPANPGVVIDPSCDFVTGRVRAACVPFYIAYVIQQIFMFTGAICLLVIMYGGYELALADLAGGKERGRARILWGIGGMILCAFSFFIIDLVISAMAGI